MDSYTPLDELRCVKEFRKKWCILDPRNQLKSVKMTDFEGRPSILGSQNGPKSNKSVNEKVTRCRRKTEKFSEPGFSPETTQELPAWGLGTHGKCEKKKLKIAIFFLKKRWVPPHLQ